MNTREVIERLDGWAGIRSHMRIQRKSIVVLSNGELSIDEHLWPYHPNVWSRQQLARTLNIPGGYITRCPTELAAPHFNYWINEMKDTGMKFCTRNGTNVIGILSPRYIAYSNRDFFTDTMGLQKDYTIDNFHMDDLIMECTIGYPQTRIDDSYGLPGTLSMGLYLRNSEVGYSSALVAATIHRDGWRIPLGNFLRLSFIRQVHIGDHTSFAPQVATLVDLIQENYSDVLAAYQATGRYSMTVDSVRDLVQEYKLAKDALDGHLGIELYSAPIGDRLNMRNVIESIATHASTQPRRWEIERICGEVLQRYELYALEM